MNTQQRRQNTAGVLSVPVTLAYMLDGLDRQPRGAGAGQYQAVATRLSKVLSELDQDTLDLLLRASPAAAEIYENLNYAHAGLCRSDLDLALSAEMQAHNAIRVARQCKSGATGAC